MNLQNEIWKDIVGYEGMYQVSNTGQIKSLSRKTNKNRKEKILAQRKSKGGYLIVNLYKSGKAKTHYVHRLVALAFVENPNALPEINHKDENCENNQSFNLEWCFPKYNANYGTRLKRIITSEGHQARLKRISKPVLQFDKNGQMLCQYLSVNAAARAMKIKQGSISRCCLGQSKFAGGYIWKYAE